MPGPSLDSAAIADERIANLPAERGEPASEAGFIGRGPFPTRQRTADGCLHDDDSTAPVLLVALFGGRYLRLRAGITSAGVRPGASLQRRSGWHRRLVHL